jgi:plasmid maintenance system antidote protein VapI
MRNIEFGECLLLKLLHERDMTQAELAEITGITESQISLYISGKRKMSLLSAVKIAFALKCHVEELYIWEQK